ncbi:hypothetical protein MRB53_016223 [Persea americana]|uniref:Uncharacterized protein n=1 Tax=Persea americana TaxID=3435 RepID=A0ACC2M1S8_PERAE|nr:hypothetical protein MRB53_016223 [Persea americana]
MILFSRRYIFAGTATAPSASLSFFFIKSIASTRCSSRSDAFDFLLQRRHVATVVFINSKNPNPVFIDTARRSLNFTWSSEGLRKKQRLETRIFSSFGVDQPGSLSAQCSLKLLSLPFSGKISRGVSLDPSWNAA